MNCQASRWISINCHDLSQGIYKHPKINFLTEKYRGYLDSKNMKKTYFTNSERSVTLNARLFRTIENLGVGGIERAVHHDGQDDREGH